MTIRDERAVLDTNVWIFGLRYHSELPAFALLLERLGQLQVILPRQVLRELQANLTDYERLAAEVTGACPDEGRVVKRMLTLFIQKLSADG